MTAYKLDAHVKRLLAAGLTVEQAVVQVSELVEQIESEWVTKRDLEEMEVALGCILQEMEIALHRNIKELEVTTRRDFQDLEAVTQRDLDNLEARLEARIKDLEWTMGQRE